MRIFTYELKKLLSYRGFIFITAACIFMAVISSLNSVFSHEADPKEYRKFFSAVGSMNDDETAQYIDENLEATFSGNGIYSSASIFPLSEQFQRIGGYTDFLSSIEERCASITNLSIFADKNSFAYKNAVKTRTAYSSLKNTELPFDISEGVELAVSGNISDILMIFAMFAAAVFVFTKDKEIGIMNLLHSYPKGRSDLCIGKLEVLLISSFAINVIFMALKLMIGALTFGLGDLNRPIQAINGFMECSYNMSVWQYILVALIFKSLGGFLWGVLFSLICTLYRNSAQIYGVSAIIVIAEFLLYSKISTISKYGLLHDLNFVSFLKPDNIFSAYRNLNILGIPFNASIVIPLVWGIILTALSVSVMIIFAGGKNTEYKKILIGSKNNRCHKIHGKMFYALKKSLILQGSLAVIAVWIVAVGVFHASFSKPADIVDMYYQNYTCDNSGTVTDKTNSIINENDEYFKEIHERLTDGDLTMSERNRLQNEQNRESAFEMFKSRCNAIRDSRYDTEIFYDSGYKRAFGVNDKSEHQLMYLLILLLCALTISPLISYDKSRGLTSVIFSTASGKRSYIKRNITAAIIFSLFASIVVMFPYFFNIISEYGTHGISQPIQSIEAFADLVLPLNVWQYALGFFLLRSILFTICGLIMLTVSYRSKSRFSAVLINMTIFVMPALIVVLGGTGNASEII